MERTSGSSCCRAARKFSSNHTMSAWRSCFLFRQQACFHSNLSMALLLPAQASIQPLHLLAAKPRLHFQAGISACNIRYFLAWRVVTPDNPWCGRRMHIFSDRIQIQGKEPVAAQARLEGLHTGTLQAVVVIVGHVAQVECSVPASVHHLFMYCFRCRLQNSSSAHAPCQTLGMHAWIKLCRGYYIEFPVSLQENKAPSSLNWVPNPTLSCMLILGKYACYRLLLSSLNAKFPRDELTLARRQPRLWPAGHWSAVPPAASLPLTHFPTAPLASWAGKRPPQSPCTVPPFTLADSPKHDARGPGALEKESSDMGHLADTANDRGGAATTKECH